MKLIRNPHLPIYYRGMPGPILPVRNRLIRPQMGQKLDDLQMTQGDRTYGFDANNGLADGAAAISATGYAQYAGIDGIVDLGGNQGITVSLPPIDDISTYTPQQPRIDAVCVVDVTAVTTSGTASEKLILVGCNSSAFSSNVQQLGMMEFGAASAQEQANGALTAAPPSVGGSRYEILFSNEQNNVKYQYVKLYVVIAASGSITFRAFIAVLPEP